MRILAPALTTARGASAEAAALQVDEPGARVAIQAPIVADGRAVVAGDAIAGVELVHLHVMVELALEQVRVGLHARL